MLLALCLDKIIDNWCKKPPSCMDELREQAKGYIQMEEMSIFQNEAQQARSSHQAQLAQVGQEAQARQAPASL